jgi:bisphosphoglycerate-dependent phosphoglycerate mutase
MNPQTIEQLVSEHCNSVKTNTDLANKEIWFIADNIEDFLFAFELNMKTPIKTEIVKRIIFLNTLTPNWQKQLINQIKRGRRILCIAEKASVRQTFWVLVWKYTLYRELESFWSRRKLFVLKSIHSKHLIN